MDALGFSGLVILEYGKFVARPRLIKDRIHEELAFR
jgi:hypothetical protein